MEGAVEEAKKGARTQGSSAEGSNEEKTRGAIEGAKDELHLGKGEKEKEKEKAGASS